ncbi:MAG: hypothetical protein ACE5HK_00540 [Candidatus Methylomirabilales bacterium]
MGRERRPPDVSRVQLEGLRDRTLRRRPQFRVRGQRSALAFVNQVGACFTFSRFGTDFPCLWTAVCGKRHPRWPRHTHHDPAVLLAWELKDVLPEKRLAYYGKLIQGRPTLVALDLLPAFIALIREGRRSGDFLLDYRSGLLSRAAARILEALLEESPLATPALRRRAGLEASTATRTFEGAITELQRRLWIVKVEAVYEPRFYYRWDLLDNWLPAAVRTAEGLSQAQAVDQIVDRHLSAVLYAGSHRMERLFGLSREILAGALGRLAAGGRVSLDQRIRGLPGTWVLAASARASR